MQTILQVLHSNPHRVHPSHNLFLFFGFGFDEELQIVGSYGVFRASNSNSTLG